MEYSLQHIIDSLSRPTGTDDPVTPAEALELAREYPFFTLPAVLALRDNDAAMDADTRETLLRLIASNTPEPVKAFMLADIDYNDWLQFYPAPRPDISTTDAITKFLDTYGHSDPREDALLERLIFNPTPDYASVLERDEREQLQADSEPASANASSGSGNSKELAAHHATHPTQDDLINSFIQKHRGDESSLLPRQEPDLSAAREPSPAAPEEHTAPSHAAGPVAVADSSLSESLAKIYIRRKRYDKAFEIIHTLSLNNPKKSAYFADQLRFLRKLMLNRPGANNSK